MIYTEVEKKELDEVQRVFAEHLRQCPDYELLWSDKVGYVWLAIGLEPLYVDTGRRIVSAEDLCRECLESIAYCFTAKVQRSRGRGGIAGNGKCNRFKRAGVISQFGIVLFAAVVLLAEHI